MPCRFYFAYCEAGFDARYLHNFHLVWTKDSTTSTTTTTTTINGSATSAVASSSSSAPPVPGSSRAAGQQQHPHHHGLADAVVAGAQAIRSVVAEEIPSDTPTQV